jgi:dihydroneopterin aldolase
VHSLPDARAVSDSLILEVANIQTDVLTGIYSEETGRAQPLRITIRAELPPRSRYTPDCPLDASKNYMDLKFAATEGLPRDVHFTLIESVADHICETLFLQDPRLTRVSVKIVKLAISEGDEEIGMTLTRERPQ